MKGKLLALFFIVVLACCTIGFVGCEVGGNGHSHTYATEWTYNETDHWHEATCEHKWEISGKEKHSFVDNICSVCVYKYIDKTQEFTVTFDPNGGILDESFEPVVSVVYGSLLDEPVAPKRSGHIFKGWS